MVVNHLKQSCKLFLRHHQFWTVANNIELSLTALNSRQTSLSHHKEMRKKYNYCWGSTTKHTTLTLVYQHSTVFTKTHNLQLGHIMWSVASSCIKWQDNQLEGCQVYVFCFTYLIAFVSRLPQKWLLQRLRQERLHLVTIRVSWNRRIDAGKTVLSPSGWPLFLIRSLSS